MKCPNCNTEIVDNAKFCHNCGKIVVKLYPNRNEHGQWGYADEVGNIIIPHKYCVANSFENGLAFVQYHRDKGYSKGALIDNSGDIIKELDYARIGGFYDGVALVNKGGDFFNYAYSEYWGGGLYGYIDESGEEITPVCYQDATIFKNGYAAINVSLDDKCPMWVFIDQHGKQITNNTYVDIGFGNLDYHNDREQYHCFGHDDSYYRSEADDDWGFFSDRAKVSDGQKWGFINTSGKEAIPLQYDEVKCFLHKYYTTVKSKNGWGIIDRLGNSIIPTIYDDIRLFSDGSCIAYASLTKDKRCGVIKIDFDEIAEIVPFEYDSCIVDIENKRILIRNKKRGILNLDGKEIIPCLFDDIDCSVSSDFLIVIQHGKFGIIDWSYNSLVPCEYNFVQDEHMSLVPNEGIYWEYFFSEGYFWIEEEGKCGTINLKGEVIIPCIYDNVLAKFRDGIAIVEKGESYFCVDYYGNEASLSDYTLDRYWANDGAIVNIYDSTDGHLVDIEIIKQLLNKAGRL